MARYASRPLAPLLELMAHSERARFMPSWSFPHGLRVKHSQQAAQGGGYTGYSDGLRFEYNVPEEVCTAGSGISTSALLAVMDEATSWASIGADTARRPGVSVGMWLDLVEGAPSVGPGERLVFTSHVAKLGRSMGFISCRIAHGSSGALLAVGRHTKYLDMGRGWATLFGPHGKPVEEQHRLLDECRQQPQPVGECAWLCAALKRSVCLLLPLAHEAAASHAGSTLSPTRSPPPSCCARSAPCCPRARRRPVASRCRGWTLGANCRARPSSARWTAARST